MFLYVYTRKDMVQFLVSTGMKLCLKAEEEKTESTFDLLRTKNVFWFGL